MSSTAVEARGVATRFLDAAALLVGGAINRYRPADPGDFASKLLVLLQPAPSRIIRLILDVEPAPVELVRGKVSTMPNGAELEKAAEDLIAATLAVYGQDFAEAAVEYAATITAGGFVIEVNPTTGHVRLILCLDGEPLDRGVILGGVASDPPTMH